MVINRNQQQLIRIQTTLNTYTSKQISSNLCGNGVDTFKATKYIEQSRIAKKENIECKITHIILMIASSPGYIKIYDHI